MLSSTYEEARTQVIRCLDRFPGTIEVLEVGGGAGSRLVHPRAEFTVLELDKESLARSSYATTGIIGDVHDHDFGDKRFDVIVLWNVVEHLNEPIKALNHVSKFLAPSGIVIIGGPEPRALKSMIAALTPHAFHVEFYKRVLGKQRAGEPGYAPYPIAESADSSPISIRKIMRENGLNEELSRSYVGDQVLRLKAYSSIAYAAYDGLSRVIRAATMGKFGAAETEFVSVYSRA